MDGGFLMDKEKRNKFLRENCCCCAKEGTYKCKMLFNEEDKCMFFEEYDEDNPYCFGGY